MVLGNFKGHKYAVTCCAISANGKLAVSSSWDCTVKVGGIGVHVMCRYGISMLSSACHQVDLITNFFFFLFSFFILIYFFFLSFFPFFFFSFFFLYSKLRVGNSIPYFFFILCFFLFFFANWK